MLRVAQTALIERAGYVAFANQHAFTGKIGAAVAAVRRGGATHTFDTINHMFQMSQMIIPGSTYWNIAFGRKKGEAADDREGMDTIKTLAVNMAWLIKKLAG